MAVRREAPPCNRCRCGRPVFFHNLQCVVCGAELGYEPSLGQVVSLRAASNGLFAIDAARTAESAAGLFKRCANFDSPARCNWLVAAGHARFCVACNLNRTIPNLAEPANAALWRRIERAKCHLVAQLLALKLPLESWRDGPSGRTGLAFDFKQTTSGSPVITGHDNGVITLNVIEADDVARERTRSAMGEPYRTLLGHLRHETGHYYWDRLVKHTGWIEPFRDLFGSETVDYASAMARHYRLGPPAGWQRAFISAYATSHPWEDWAETWAHYLHMVDALETASRMGIRAASDGISFRPFGPDRLWRRDRAGGDAFLKLLNDWVGLTAGMNEMCRSIGQADFYPFVLSGAVVTKLHLIHCLVHDPQRAGASAPRDATRSEETATSLCRSG
jgi:hypothetical protein